MDPDPYQDPGGLLQPEINQDTENHEKNIGKNHEKTMVSQGHDLQMVDLFFHIYGGVLEDRYIYIHIYVYIINIYIYKYYIIILYYIILH